MRSSVRCSKQSPSREGFQFEQNTAQLKFIRFFQATYEHRIRVQALQHSTLYAVFASLLLRCLPKRSLMQMVVDWDDDLLTTRQKRMMRMKMTTKMKRIVTNNNDNDHRSNQKLGSTEKKQQKEAPIPPKAL